MKRKLKISASHRRISVSAPWKCYVWRSSPPAYSNSLPRCRLALVAVYFGFSYLGALDFGHYGTAVTLSAGFLALILAPEFFQPLRDLGTFYHAKAQAVGAADSLKTFMETPLAHPERGDVTLNAKEPVTLEARDFSILSPEGNVLAGPLNFTLPAGKRVVLVGISGSGKSSLLNALSGFMAYTGSLRINQTELRDLDPLAWRKQLSWVGQNPQLPAATLRDNVLLARPDARDDELQSVLDRAWVSEFLPQASAGCQTPLSVTSLPACQSVRPSVWRLPARCLTHASSCCSTSQQRALTHTVSNASWMP